jgi:hypothetical protein
MEIDKNAEIKKERLEEISNLSFLGPEERNGLLLFQAIEFSLIIL